MSQSKSLRESQSGHRQLHPTFMVRMTNIREVGCVARVVALGTLHIGHSLCNHSFLQIIDLSRYAIIPSLFHCTPLFSQRPASISSIYPIPDIFLMKITLSDRTRLDNRDKISTEPSSANSSDRPKFPLRPKHPLLNPTHPLLRPNRPPLCPQHPPLCSHQPLFNPDHPLLLRPKPSSSDKVSFPTEVRNVVSLGTPLPTEVRGVVGK